MRCWAFLWILLPIAEGTIEVRTDPLQVRGFVTKSTLLSCRFMAPRDTKLEDIAVRWTVQSRGAMRPVYSFDGNRTELDRRQTFLDLSLLGNGNASLYLKEITVEDEGEYTCTVLITPHVGHSTIALKVTAQPHMSLEPHNPTYIHGEIKTFFCIVQNYYPQKIELNWLVSELDKEQVLPKTYCTSDPALNNDGTYSVKSQIALVLNESDSGATMYICEVRHESLEQPARARTSVFLASAPLVSPIIPPALVIANEKMTFTCNINGFRPKPIIIQWYIDRPKQSQSLSIDKPLLCGEDVTHQAQQQVTKHGSVFSATSQLFYTPTVQDDGAILVCEVEHKALHATVRQKEKINITARPKKCYITSWPLVPQLGERLVLSCIAEKFYPMEISLTWLKNGQLVTDVTSFGPFLCEDDYYSMWSQTELLLTEEDDGLIYTCQINHMSFGKIEELTYEINLKGTPPEVQWIIAEPQSPTQGEEARLRCKISNFSPPDVTVNWFRNGVQLGTGVCNSLCVASARGLHSMWSLLRFPCKAEDHGSTFMCQVHHIALKNCEERSYTLSLSGKS
ncbi:hypothetical protein XENTR_v10004152 [Xenopus tropicalis]|nr:hypothetical protein XENTR_v10004152 [Xenopus tropicalis]